jgi:hypothetical protein
VLERVHLLLRSLETGRTAAALADAGAQPPDGDDDGDDVAYDPYDVIQELTPPPVPLGRNGFPRSMFPERRRAVVLAAALVVAVGALASVFDLRGADAGGPALLDATAKSSVTAPRPSSAPPSTTAPVATSAPDTTPPGISSLATNYACIGPTQRTTEAIATVTDDRGVKTVSLTVSHDVLGSTRLRMIPSGGRYSVQIGPFSADGTVTWTVEATDLSGNVATRSGPPVAASSSC